MLRRFAPLLLVALVAACTPAQGPSGPRVPELLPVAPPVARIIASGVVDCFAEGLANPDGSPATCELSAAAIAGGRLYLASDKPIPGDGRSPVFSLAFDGTLPAETRPEALTYHTAAPLLAATKYEDMAVAPDGAVVYATTGFDRFQFTSPVWDGYNTLLALPGGHEDETTVVAPTTREGVTSSLAFRTYLARLQATTEFPDGAPYFKVEGLAAAPEGRLLFGVREVGADYEHFTYVVRIIEGRLSDEEAAGPALGKSLRVLYDTTGEALAQANGLAEAVALSSLEVDPHGGRLLLLTSFETKGGMGGYLWTLPLDRLGPSARPTLVRTPDGAPLVFTHKPEAVAVVDAKTVLVVHDDDRMTGPERALHQSRWDLVRFE